MQPDERPSPLPVAEFTRDMIDTLQAYFETYERDGVVSIEISRHGLWLPNPTTGGRQFLGLARWPEKPPQRRH